MRGLVWWDAGCVLKCFCCSIVGSIYFLTGAAARLVNARHGLEPFWNILQNRFGGWLWWDVARPSGTIPLGDSCWRAVCTGWHTHTTTTGGGGGDRIDMWSPHTKRNESTLKRRKQQNRFCGFFGTQKILEPKTTFQPLMVFRFHTP